MKKDEKIIIINNVTVTSVKYGKRKVTAKNGKTYEDDKETFQIGVKLNDDNIDVYSLIWAYDDESEKFVPSWFKKQDGYMNFRSMYDLPVRYRDKIGTITSWMHDQTDEEFSCAGSVVNIKIKQSPGKIYPVAISVINDGVPRDPFEDM